MPECGKEKSILAQHTVSKLQRRMISRRYSSTPEFLFVGSSPITKAVSSGNSAQNRICSRNNQCRTISFRQCPSV